MMEKTGERFIPELSGNAYEIQVNINRYLYALPFCKDKIIIDAGCGCGLGSYLYSLVAKQVIAVDYNAEALDCVKTYSDKIECLQADLNKDLLPEADICVALESIEHLSNPDFFLKNLKTKELIFSIPLNSRTISPQFHKQDYRSIEDIKTQINKFYEIKDLFVQERKWIYGRATKL